MTHANLKSTQTYLCLDTAVMPFARPFKHMVMFAVALSVERRDYKDDFYKLIDSIGKINFYKIHNMKRN